LPRTQTQVVRRESYPNQEKNGYKKSHGSALPFPLALITVALAAAGVLAGS
jgi:hypothetical protein